MDVERQAAIALKWNAVAKLLSQTFSWAVTFIVLRLLTPEDYGLMAIATVTISIVAGMAEFGLGAALIQKQTLHRQELSAVAGALGALNVFCGLVLFIAAPALAEIFGDARLAAIIRVASLQFVFTAIDVVPQSLIQREMNFRRNAGIELSAMVVASSTTLVLAWLDCGVWSLVVGNLAGCATRTTLLVMLGTIVSPSLRWQGIVKQLHFGGLVTLTRFIWQLTYQLDTLIAGRFLTREAVGFYSVSMHLATLPMNKAMGIINQVAFPAVARLQDELPRLRAHLLDALRLLAFVAVPVLWGLSAVAYEFVDVVLGDKWHTAVATLQLVGLVAPARMFMAILATSVEAIGQAGIELRNTLISALILPTAFLIGVQWELIGLATSWLIAMPLILALNLRRTSRALGLSLRSMLNAVHAPLLAGVAMYATVAIVRLALDDFEEIIRLPVLIAAGALAYLLAVRLIDWGIWTDTRRLLVALRN
ncbi:MAG TPA: lipopolysaccharide biosynthesis protein [Povalibacter sp.]|nr:lipopolysaccharide biosynthesis protein [Povalibacter sp.]